MELEWNLTDAAERPTAIPHTEFLRKAAYSID